MQEHFSILIVAGEVSGDRQGAFLARAILGLDPGVKLYGAGGDEMSQAGVDLRLRTSNLGSVGVQESLPYLWSLRRAFRRMKDLVKSERPDVAVLIDNETFSMALARTLKQQNIPVIFYFPPQVSLWGRWRTRQVVRVAGLIVAPFQAEVEAYRKAGARVVCGGHPLLDIVKPALDPTLAFTRVGLDPLRPTAALLPGSRVEERDRNTRRRLHHPEPLRGGPGEGWNSDSGNGPVIDPHGGRLPPQYPELLGGAHGGAHAFYRHAQHPAGTVGGAGVPPAGSHWGAPGRRRPADFGGRNLRRGPSRPTRARARHPGASRSGGSRGGPGPRGSLPHTAAARNSPRRGGLCRSAIGTTSITPRTCVSPLPLPSAGWPGNGDAPNTFDPIEVTPVQLISGSRTIQGWAAGTPTDSEDTLRFADSTGVRPRIETYPLERAAGAFPRMLSGRARFRVVLTM
ncbi:MAG: hypothetical protein LAQ30_25635 [Acidobacteriia bacterium]|nr:hypothetical protein [Terriglobia bacterium]